jgi:flagellar biosynthesis chaperone FliJ
MERITVANALRHLENFLHILDNAYWEANKIVQKDIIYDLISAVHGEINELAKLSVDDHYLAYEPITSHFANSQSKLKSLQANLNHWVHRSTTSRLLESELPQITAFFHTNI